MSEKKPKMEVEGEFEVKLCRTFIVKATNPTVGDDEPLRILPLSNLDLLSGRFPVTYLYFYPHNKTHDESITESLSASLSLTLNYYYPFAGRISSNPLTEEPEIVCDNSGALLVEAYANIPLKHLNFYNLDECLARNKLAAAAAEEINNNNNNNNKVLQIQVTFYTCGGVSITFTFDHALGDATSFGKFLLSWSEIARSKPISCVPDHRRSFHLRPRCPPSYHSSLDRTFVKCTMEEIMNIPCLALPAGKTLVKRLYFIENSAIDHLQSVASSNGKRRTKIEAVSAYIWKALVNSIDMDTKSMTSKMKMCKMGWLVDGRSRLQIGELGMSNYIGNVLSLAFGEASVSDLKEGSISEVADMVSEAIGKVANEEHFMDLIDWIECHRPGLMLSKLVLGLGEPSPVPALVFSSGRMFPVRELDFGFGSPVLGTVCSTIQRIGVAYMNQRSSAKGDGSWTISSILWPQLAAALESDSIFQPINTTHLQL